MLSATSVLIPHPQIVETPLDDGELALLRVDTRQFYRLNETGAWIWSRLREGEALGEIALKLAARYALGDVDPLSVVVALVNDLAAAGLVAEQHEPATPW